MSPIPPLGAIQRRVWISGRVQGVGFRASTLAEAKARQRDSNPELRGWVRNLPDGRVEAVFSGPQSLVLGLVEWCRHGPPSAQIIQIEVREETVDSELPPFGIDRSRQA